LDRGHVKGLEFPKNIRKSDRKVKLIF